MKITRDDKLYFGIGMALGWLALFACFLCSPGCALFRPCPVDGPADTLAQDVREFAADGTFDATEFKIICRDAGFVERALEEKAKPWQPPMTGIPWLDAALALAGAAATVATAVKTTNVIRDRKRVQRGEPTEPTKAT